jgi:hypothetical protein
VATENRTFVSADGSTAMVLTSAVEVTQKLADGWTEHQPPAEAAAERSLPAKGAVKAEWVEHAVASGVDRDEAEALTKDQLVERFGAGAGEER